MAITLDDAVSASDYKEIKELYKTAFPAAERAPYFMVKKKAKAGKGTLLIAKDKDAFVGFTYLLCYLDLVYIFYLAIDSSQRGKGYGSAILSALQKKYNGKKIFLAREQLDEKSNNYEQRVKRHVFYLQNGFEDLPCKIKEASVVYDVMGIGGAVSAAEYEALITDWTGKLVRKIVDMRIIE